MRCTPLQPLVAIASGQFGMFSLRQASDVGVSRDALRKAAVRGWVSPVRRGVYAFAGVAPTRWQAVYAAALAAGSSAVISHTSAATVHSLYGVAPVGIELTVPNAEARRLAGVTIHRSTTLRRGDVDFRNRAAVTTPVRTVIDLAPRFHEPLLGKIVDEGSICRLWTPETLMARIDRLPKETPGLAELRSVLQARTGEGHPDSVLEQRIIRVVRRHFSGFQIHAQVTVGGEVFIVDIAWLDRKVAAEIDGLAVRTTSLSKFDHVLRRDNKLRRNGWRVVHLTAGMREAEIVAELVPYIPLRGTAG